MEKALKCCENTAHQKAIRRYVCLNPKCSEDENLVCPTCLFEKHKACLMQDTLPLDIIQAHWKSIFKDSKISWSEEILAEEIQALDQKIHEVGDVIGKAIRMLQEMKEHIGMRLVNWKHETKRRFETCKILGAASFSDEYFKKPEYLEQLAKVLRGFIKPNVAERSCSGDLWKIEEVITGIPRLRNIASDWIVQFNKLLAPSLEVFSQYILPENFYEKEVEWKLDTYGPNWNVSGKNIIDGISLQAQEDCFLAGVGQFYSSCTFGIKARLEVFEGVDFAKRVCLSSEDIVIPPIPARCKAQKEHAYPIYFNAPVRLRSKQVISIALTYSESIQSATLFCGEQEGYHQTGALKVSPLNVEKPFVNLSEDIRKRQFPFFILMK